jgi:hypothetical protein
MRETVFEVHYWPATGRVLAIHIPNFGLWADEPILTEITVSGGGATLADTTYVIARSLADAGDPVGEVIEHAADGSVRTLNMAGMPRYVPGISERAE